MTDEQRKRIYEALLGDVSMFAAGDLARQTLEESALKQLEAVEPLIEKMLAEAWTAGFGPICDEEVPS
jgi:hypothetical protein